MMLNEIHRNIVISMRSLLLLLLLFIYGWLCASTAYANQSFSDIRYFVGNSSANGEANRIVLGSNMMNGVNTLTQSMINTPNTIYTIQDDFVLATNITIPANCVLKFEGGSISGAYTLKGTETFIDANMMQIFGPSVTLAGTWRNNEAYPEWFGAKGDGSADDTKSVISVLKAPFPLVAFCKKYKITESLYVGNKSIRGVSADNSAIIYTGSGVGVYFGCYADNVYSGLFIRDISIIGNEKSKCGLHIQNVWKCNFDNIIVNDVINGIGIKTYSTANNGFYWNNFKNCHVKSVKSGIVFDSDRTRGASNANSIISCSFHTVINGIEILYGDAIVIESCSFEFCSGSAIITESKSTKITKNRFESNNYDITLGKNCQYQFITGNYTPASQLWIVDNSINKNGFDISRYESKSPGTSKRVFSHKENNAIIEDMVIKMGNEFGKVKKPVLLIFNAPIKSKVADTIWVQLRAGDRVVSETMYKYDEPGIQNITLVGLADTEQIKSNPQKYSVHCWSTSSGNELTISSTRFFYAQCLNNGYN